MCLCVYTHTQTHAYYYFFSKPGYIPCILLFELKDVSQDGLIFHVTFHFLYSVVTDLIKYELKQRSTSSSSKHNKSESNMGDK